MVSFLRLNEGEKCKVNKVIENFVYNIGTAILVLLSLDFLAPGINLRVETQTRGYYLKELHVL